MLSALRGGQDTPGTGSQSSLRFRCGAAEVPRVTRLQREDDGEREREARRAEEREGKPADNPARLAAQPLSTRRCVCDRACVCCTASRRGV